MGTKYRSPKVGRKYRWISEVAICWLLESVRSLQAIVLDAPCGSGVIAERISMHGVKIIGVDLERGKLERVKERLDKFDKNVFGLVVSDIRHLPFGNKQFHHILSLRSLYYLKPVDRQEALYEFRRVLREDGRIIVSTITAFSVIFHQTFFRTTRTHKHRIFELLDLLPLRWLMTFNRVGLRLCRALAFFPYMESRYQPSQIVETLDKLVRPLADKLPFYLL